MNYCGIDCTIDVPQRLTPRVNADGGATFCFSAEPGLCQLSIIVDASRFDWESLYVNLTRFGNTGQRTGPWDFDIREETSGKPLVPAYRVHLDGRNVGMWFFQRVSLEDMAHKRFRGNTVIWIRHAGQHDVTLTPFRPMDITWLSARLEVDPEDQLHPVAKNLKPAANANPIARWAGEDFWDEQGHRLRDMGELFNQPLQNAFDGAIARCMEKPGADWIPLLVAAHHLNNRPGAIELALRAVDDLVARPAWGNPDPDGYSHNGDLGAAREMLNLSRAVHMLRGHLGEHRRARVLEKLAHHGEIFAELAPLNRDYWGGSLLQDHGRKSFSRFTATALNLLGIIPEAERWLSYALPRTMRGLDAMPRDGVIPSSSYYAPWMYLDDADWLRNALLSQGGQDLYDLPQFHPIVDYVWTVLHERDGVLLIPCNFADRMPLLGGGSFFAAMAKKFSDDRAQWLATRTLQQSAALAGETKYDMQFHSNTLWTFLAYDASAATPAPAPPTRRHLVHYEDSGIVHYRDDTTRMTFAAQCGPWLGHHAYRKAKSPCDRIGGPPGEGHFIVAIDGTPLLMTPEPGCRLNSFLRSCLLIDGMGQVGDVGYPMSIPSMPYRGQEVQSVAWDPTNDTGLVRLHLAPAYGDDLDVIDYTRDFVFGPRRELICRDQLTLGTPRMLSWLFQGMREAGIVLEEGLRCRFGDKTKLWINPVERESSLKAKIVPTDVIWSYSGAGGFKPFDHVRYDTAKPVRTACASFRITW